MKKGFLTRNCKDCFIVITEEAAVVERTAAQELQAYVEKALGAKLSIVSEKDAEGKCIYVGQTAYALAAGVVGSSKENWIMKMHEGNLILTGGKERGDRGIIYAVYHFLEDVLGVRWWNPYEEDVLVLEELSLEDDFCKEGTPYFPYRKLLMDSGAGVDFFSHVVRTRTNVISALDDNIPDGVYDPGVRKYGDVKHMGRPHHVHVMGKYFPADQYYEEHPDWWAWNRVQGKHLSAGHYCFSNEGFFNALCERLLATIKEDMELSKKTGVEFPDFYSLSLDDKLEYCFCQCDECSKIIKESGYSGYILKFVNRVAHEVEKVCPYAKVETNVYLCQIEPPKDDTLPAKNVIIRLAEVYNDLVRGVHSPTNKKYLRLLEAWSAICKKAGCDYYIWDYMYNIELNYPLPIFYRLKDTIQTFAECGVSGVFIETQYRFADAWDLNKYMLYHLFEDPYADEEALIDDFVTRYYGKAGKCVKEYLGLLRETVERNKIHVYCCDEDSPFNYIDLSTVIKGSVLLDQAVSEVGELEPYRSRVNWLRKPLDTVIASRYFDFKKLAEIKGEVFDFDIKAVKERIIAALKEFVEKPYHAKAKNHVNREIAHFTNLPEEEETFDIPEILAGVKEEDIYQFPMKNVVKFILAVFEKPYGFSTVEDEAVSISKVMKLSFDTATGFRAGYTMVPTSKYAERKKPINFHLRDEEEIVAELDLYQEDIVQDGYHLYKVGSISGISDSYSARLLLPEEISINLSGLAVVFPMDACDVYLSMKFTGEIYGGKKEEENAMYFERMIVVRK